MAEKLYALVTNQRVDNIITLLTEDEEGYAATLEEGVDLIELEETEKQDWQFYSTSSNSLIPPLFLGHDKIVLEEGTDYSSHTITFDSNTDITSISELLAKGKKCTVSILSTNITNPREVSVTLSISNLDYTDPNNQPKIGDFEFKSVVDSEGWDHRDILPLIN